MMLVVGVGLSEGVMSRRGVSRYDCYLPTCLLICLPMHLPIYLPIYLTMYLTICLSICLPIVLSAGFLICVGVATLRLVQSR
jgi:hypothetical protein